MLSARAFLFALIPALLLPFLTSACSGSAKVEEPVEEVVKITPPEVVLRDFYTALDNDARETANALLSKRAKLVDPKGGSLLSNTAALIQQIDGIAKFSVLKVGAEIVEVEHNEDGSEDEQRTVTVEFEITFNNGETRHSESQLVYEQVNTAEESEDGAPSASTAPGAEFGWRVEGVRQVWQED